MKTSKFLLLAATALTALCVAGCSTPESRIRKNPEAFARLTPAQQDLISKGQIAIGFDQEMVQLALGEPDHIITRTDAKGASEIWSYTTYESTDGMLLYRGWYHRYYYWGDPMFPYYLDYPHRRERDHYRVTFKDGKAVTIEEHKQ
jgi:outer membrane protein assembly factor BamE (lipoprotein component of BamABCDE complex)